MRDILTLDFLDLICLISAGLTTVLYSLPRKSIKTSNYIS